MVGLLVHGEVVQFVAVALAVRRAKGVGAVATAARGVPEEGPVRGEHQLHKDGRLAAQAARQQLLGLVDARQVGHQLLQPRAQHQVVLAVHLLVEQPLGHVGGRLVEQLGRPGEVADDDALRRAVACDADQVRVLLRACRRHAAGAVALRILRAKGIGNRVSRRREHEQGE